VRVYLPTTLPDLADILAKGEVGPSPLQAFAVTPALREAYASGDDEELEYVAMLAAATQSLRLLHADPGAPRRRVVLAADVPDASVSWQAYDDEPATVQVSGEVPLKAIAADMDHANMPIGPVGKPTEQQNILNTYAYAYSKYPNAVREYLRFMWDKDQVDYWEAQSNGYVAPPLPAWNDNPVWTADPKVTPFRDVLKYALDDGYSGALGNASAAVMGDFVVVDMFAEACTGNKSAKDAAHDAAERVKRYYNT